MYRKRGSLKLICRFRFRWPLNKLYIITVIRYAQVTNQITIMAVYQNAYTIRL